MATTFVRSGISMQWVGSTPRMMASDFDKLGVNVRSFREPLKRSIQQVLAPSFQHNFDVGGRPTWRPLTDDTVTRKQRLGYSPDPLVRTGLLQRVAGQLNIWEIDRESAQVNVGNLPRASYGAVHQLGSEFIAADGFSKGVPQRPWAVIQEEDANEVEEVFFTWIEERIDADIAAGRRVAF